MSSHERVDVGAVLAQLGDSVKSFLTTRGISLPVFVGIHTGGVWVAEALHAHCTVAEPLGMLDVSYHRDDVARTGVRPLKPVCMPASLDDRHVLLIDDVLFTGRTTRAALNELFEYGRPASVSLVVLVERPGREVPVAPDLTGMRLELGPEDRVKLQGPEPMELVITRTHDSLLEEPAR